MTRTLDIETREPLEALVDRIYRNRFPREILARRSAVWRVLSQSWFARYIPEGASVLEVAAGCCEFINNIPAHERVAVDLNPETRLHAAPDVTVHEIAAERLCKVVPQAHFDAAFMSNFLEHCRTREQVLDVLRGLDRVETGWSRAHPRPQFPLLPQGLLRLLRPPLAVDGEVRCRGARARGLRRSSWRSRARCRSRSAAGFRAGRGWSGSICGCRCYGDSSAPSSSSSGGRPHDVDGCPGPQRMSPLTVLGSGCANPSSSRRTFFHGST